MAFASSIEKLVAVHGICWALCAAACSGGGSTVMGSSGGGRTTSSSGGASGATGGGAGASAGAGGSASAGAPGSAGNAGAAGAVASARTLPSDSLAVRFADAVMIHWPAATEIHGTTLAFEYNAGIVLRGMEQVYRYTHDTRYLAYIQAYLDAFVGAAGTFTASDGSSTLAAGHSFDTVQPGVLLPFMYTETGDARYRTAAGVILAEYVDWPRNAEGGFWHKDVYPNEMWLDSIYMGEPFLARYASVFSDCGSFCLDTVFEQTNLIAAHVENPVTGLLVHAWDQDKNAVWADPTTGCSGQVWGRALGWYAMSLVDLLTTVPDGDTRREAFITRLRSIAAALAADQDAATGLWYQVVDEGALSDDWVETSASGMFVYALKVGVDRGYLDPSYATVAAAGWAGLKTQVISDAQGLPVIGGAVQGMGVQATYADYVNKQRLSDSPHGLCAILLAASEMEAAP